MKAYRVQYLTLEHLKMLSEALWFGLVSFCAGIVSLYFTTNPLSWVLISLGVSSFVFILGRTIFLYLVMEDKI